MSSKFGTLSGKGLLIGRGIPQTFPIQLDPAAFEGAVIYADNGELRYSDGVNWLTTGTGPQGLQGTTGVQGLQGLQGEYGPGFTIIGSIPGPGDQSVLNTAFGSAVTGDGVIDQSDDTLWIYDGVNWINIGSFRGVQGFTGVQGTQGVQGPLGNEGIQGERGHRGFQGERGVQGFQGTQGLLGFQGIQGRRGPQGVQGITGIQGDLGFQGTQGRAGPQGVQGTTGIQGDTGIQGSVGSYGGVTFEFDFSTSVVAQDPTPGQFAINSTSAATASALFIDDLAKNGSDLSTLLNSIDTVPGPVKGYIQITRVDDIAEFITYEVRDIVDNTGWLTLQVTHVASSANVLTGAGSQAFALSFSRAGAQGIQGTNGVQGIQGLLGFQGTQGVQGLQGLQGTNGIQGNTGTQGTQGLQGVQGRAGPQGIQGLQGVQGDTGAFGGLTYDYTYSNNTTAEDPGQGFVRFNSVDLSAATDILIDDLDDAGVDISPLFTEIQSVVGSPKGYLKVIDGADVTKFTTFRVDGATDSTGYWTLVLVYIQGETSFANNADLRVSFSRNGDQGVQGTQGIQGLQGRFGPQGTQGIQGEQGIQGMQGLQGLQGIQGEAIQGTQGVQGTTGSQGLQGIQGVQGGTGGQGTQGVQGTTGSQGLQGVQGEQGEYGGLTFAWNFNANTIGGTDPGTSQFKFNNSNPQLATLITLDDVPDDQYTTEIDPFLDFIAAQPGAVKGYLKVQVGAGGDPGPGGHHWLIYEITGWTWDGAGKNYGFFDVTYVDGSTNNWATVVASHGSQALISFIPRGPAGIQGVQGTLGLQGLQGSIGAGTQGVQGIQGNLGLQGAEGSFGGVTFDYTFRSDTNATDPGTGGIKLNNATQSSATVMFIDDRDDGFIDIQPFLRTIDDSTSPIKGHFKITLKSTPNNFILFTISSLSETSGFFAVSCAHVSNGGYTFQEGDDITITFARTGDAGATGSTGAQGVQGLQGPQGTQGLQGSTGAGVQGAAGELGTQGVQGVQGTQGNSGGLGVQGIQGLIGIQGDLGIQGTAGEGAQGVQGIQGIIGNQGIAGAGGIGGQGVQGIQGLQGLQGFDGSQGTGGFDGQPGPSGSQGIQGADGAGFQGIQGLTGFQGLGGSGPQGTQGLQGADGDGSQGVQGPFGPQGLQGIQGAGGTGFQGASGLQGDFGFQGTQGLQGIPGGASAQGFQGIQGNQGLQGQDGTGAPGIQGYGGWQGIQGLIGPVGGYGIQGPLGIQGSQGTQGGFGTGLQGIQGTIGIQGNPGDAGGFGSQGTQGLIGFQGADGEIGLQGFSGEGSPGIQGSIGPQGTTGEGGQAGNQGPSGPIGPIGPQGTTGSQGIGVQGSTGAGFQGDTGSPGAQGFPGFQGATGSIGPQGISGVTGEGIQGIQGLLGYQGTTGPLGPQGTSGSSSAIDVASLHTSGLQGTAMFVTLVQGGSGARPLYGTTTPNPGGQQNFFYTADDDELTLENLNIDGSVTLNGSTITTWPSGSGGYDSTGENIQTAGGLRFNDNVALHFGTGEDIDISYTGTTFEMSAAVGSDFIIKEGVTTRFTFDTGLGDFTATGNVTTNSDARLKENVETVTGALDKITSLRGVTYNKIGNERSELGLIAQEVEAVLPEVVITADDEIQTKSISYGNIIGVLVEAIKELKAEIEELKK